MSEPADGEDQDDELTEPADVCAVCGTALRPDGASLDYCSELCQKAFLRRAANPGSAYGPFVLPRRGVVVRWFDWLTSFLL